PIQYLKSLRMRLASELLLTTQKSIFHIAELVGYSSQAAFSRVFSQTFNYSPSEFRESFKNNPAQE
ncbi:MAG: helix-turn-helix transcriptional regulator, partial [Pseudomonadota bacterium]